VSLYNESRGRDIDPTPVVGTLGLVDRLIAAPPGARLVAGTQVLLLGPADTAGLGGSRWAASIHGHRGGRLAALDLELHGRLVALLAGLVNDQLLAGVHDVSDGGLGLALAEMAVRSGVGAAVSGIASHVDLFGEAPSRVLVCVSADSAGQVRQRADQAGVPVTVLGTAGGERFVVDGLVDLSVPEMVEVWRTALPKALGLEGASAGAAAS
jgi:phosphoribosylformylglycinamidine synthase